MLRVLPGAGRGERDPHSSCPPVAYSQKRSPTISHAGMTYRFNFLRLSLVCQSADPAFHLDSDAATALTGDVVG